MRKLLSRNQLALDMVYSDGTYSVFENSVPTKGYVVANKLYSLTYNDSLDFFTALSIVEFYVNLHWDYVRNVSGMYFGRWLDTQTNTVYLDIVKIFEDEIEAAKFARHQGEIAYFDLYKMVEVRV